MIKWFIDRENKVPLYLQLKDLIKYYISTGAIQDNDQLPGVVTLAQELGVNFDTIRTLAGTGVDLISVGALTHSVRASDIGLEILTAEKVPHQNGAG